NSSGKALDMTTSFHQDPPGSQKSVVTNHCTSPHCIGEEAEVLVKIPTEESRHILKEALVHRSSPLYWG
ncbi:hypothetical protein LGT39_03870, partial [Demequina sp. TTPB684]|uniref:hypothetical protein n=1 Tax=Demequina sp. TTPB684 TaxID=2881057 RepID=UPI001CF27897